MTTRRDTTDEDHDDRHDTPMGRDGMTARRAFDYSGERAREVSFPLGGIGTGSIGLSGGGRLVDWEILNRPAKGITNGISHFAVRAERDGRVIDARILNGPYLGDRTGDFPADIPRSSMPLRHHGSLPGDTIVWPDIKPMWFAYRNPVSGRVPPLYCPDLKTCERDLAASR